MYDTVVERYAKSAQYPEALLAAARLRCKLQQYPQAITDFERLVEKYPQLPHLDDVLYEWAWALQDSGKPAEAAKILERLCRDHRQSRLWPDVAYRLASASMEAKDYSRARELLVETLKAKGDLKLRAHALYLQGQVAAAEENWTSLQQTMQTLLSDFPKSDLRLPATYWLAEALYRQGDYDAAGKHLERLAAEIEKQQEPWQAMILLRRAQVLAHQRRWAEAEQVASKVEKQFPAFGQQYEADYVLGRCRASQADFEGARQAYQKVIRSSTSAKTETAAMAQWMIGESYFHQKQYELALREYLRLEILYAYPTWQAGALLQAGKCHELLGQWDEATRVYERLVQSYPKTSFTEDGRRRLEAAKARCQAQAARQKPTP
jgi:TolA-binding protein